MLVNLQAAHCGQKCYELDNTIDYRIHSKVNGQWRQHLEVNMKILVVLGEGCESPYRCIQSAGKRQQFYGELGANICQKVEEREKNKCRMVLCEVNLNSI